MVSKAGQQFVCGCCKDAFDESLAVVDDQLGPVCPSCFKDIRAALAWMKKAGFVRPVNTNDLNPTNKKRILS